MVIFGLIIIGIAAWRIGRCRRQKLRARMAASQRMSRYVAEKPANAIQVNFDTMIGDEKNSYFPLPALLSRPEPAHAPNKAIKKGTNRFIGSLNMVSSQLGGKNRSSNHLSSPPPPVPAKEVVPSMPIPEITIYRKTSTRSNKSGRVDLRVDVNASALTGQALALQLLTANTANTATQVPSPRSSSQLDSPLKNIPLTARPKSAKTPGGKKLPRLMLVTATFIPSSPTSCSSGSERRCV
ncbi:hypothetical protein EUX98_g5782 [Antrodiella citrinella]|uniref:Uncharacterized protein n=1 Tax=Antrodiella citrinella TaxID=2447956 RepID=A0A4S4MQX8_9APHY|nr:hypothetical protein EUX98_g5782 [Antrodiella citrinella]